MASLYVPTQGPTQVVFETVGAGARKSACFLLLLWWSIGRHWRLRFRCPHSPPATPNCLPVVLLIAFRSESTDTETGVAKEEDTLTGKLQRRHPRGVAVVLNPHRIDSSATAPTTAAGCPRLGASPAVSCEMCIAQAAMVLSI